MSNWQKNFENPPADFRGAPFWAWNAALEPEELRRQIGIMQDMGMGGFFMHSRVGMATPYLGEKWFECINACIDEAEKRGMKAWLYDEDRWPSGAAGSLVTRDPQYRQRALYCQRIEGDPAPEKGDVWFRILWSAGEFVRYTRISGPGEGTESDGQLFRFRVLLNEPTSWYNGATYLDTLNPAAVKRFLETTHDTYSARCGKAFGKTVPGIFTDEPTYVSHADWSTPWTDALPEEFRKKYGYDILDHLPELYFDCGKTVSRVRWHYRDMLTDLFVRSFAGQIGDWCGKHGIAMTGHVLMEDTLRNQTLAVGAAMRSYEHMQMPGIDLLTEYWQIFNTAKQCTSVARQTGRDVRLSETYGCTGWDFPFMGHKALGDWQYALGINFRCQHLAWYSMEGEAKRDYPASISFQSSWHDKYHVVEDYFARLGSVLTGGKEIRDVLMIHPVESCWSICLSAGLTKSSVAEAELDRDWNSLTDHLLSVNVDFDFGDEEILSRLAKAEDGVFRVGKAEYKVVLIPRILTIRSTTLELLKKWAESGGLVVYLGEPPAFVDALPSEEAADVYRRYFVFAEKPWVEEKLLAVGRRLSVTDRSGAQIAPVLSRLAEKEGAYNLFLCNTSMTFSGPWESPMVRERNLTFPEAVVRVALPDAGAVYELDPSTGSVYEVPFRREEGSYVFRTSFAPLQSRLFLFTAERPEKISARTEFHAEKPQGALPGGDEWTYSLNDFNSLVLDHCTLKADGRTELENAFFIQADDHLRKMLGAAPRGGQMVQPWLRDKTVPEKQLDIELTYGIDCVRVPAEDCLLALERPELYSSILFNGESVSRDPAGPGWWVDPVLKTLRIPRSLFRQGKNLLTLSGRYHEKLPGLESIFLLGRFGVYGEKIGELPGRLKTGDWVKQGLQEYSGDVTYERSFEADPGSGEHWFLRFGAWRGAALTVSVNGGEERPIPWPPFELDLTSELVKGTNRIAIRVCGSRRNAFGPFFSGQKWMAWTGPAQFKMYKSSERQLVPCGLLETPSLLIRK